jgi:hypothetical protein
MIRVALFIVFPVAARHLYLVMEESYELHVEVGCLASRKICHTVATLFFLSTNRRHEPCSINPSWSKNNDQQRTLLIYRLS